MLTEEMKKKLKEAGIEDSDLFAVNEAFTAKLNEQVELKLTEAKIALEAESKTKLEEAIATETTKLEEAFDVKLKETEEGMLEAFDRFVESEIKDKISEDLIDSAGINEADAEIIKGIRELFESKYVSLDVEGQGLLKKNALALEARNKELSEALEQKMVLSEELDKVKKEKFLSENTSNLTEAQKVRVDSLFEGKDFKYTSEKLASFVQLISEEKKKEETKTSINETADSITTGDKILAEDVKPKVASTKPKNENLAAANGFL